MSDTVLLQGAGGTKPKFGNWRLRDGVEVSIRPIRADDELLMARFHQSLGPESVYTRNFHCVKLNERISHQQLDHVCHPDPDQEQVLAAESTDATGTRTIVGVGRLSKLPRDREAEVAGPPVSADGRCC